LQVLVLELELATGSVTVEEEAMAMTAPLLAMSGLALVAQ
jgi:hypothetical protein